jgi:hypothetical protein
LGFSFRPSKSEVAGRGKAAASAPSAAASTGRADLVSAASSFLQKTGLFDKDAYLERYPDVAKSGQEPAEHFARFGLYSGHKFTSEQQMARVLRSVMLSPAYTAALDIMQRVPAAHAAPQKFNVGVFVSSLGNFFMSEIADLFVHGLTRAGATARRFDENNFPGVPLTHYLVIAPHEFFVLGNGRNFAKEEFLRRTTLFTTEQMQSPWFGRSLPFMLLAKSIIDINVQNAVVLAGAGLKATCIQLGYAPDFKPFGPQADMTRERAIESYGSKVKNFTKADGPLSERPLDVLFLGTHSMRREGHLASYAKHFADLSTFLYYTRAYGPTPQGGGIMASSQMTAGLLQRSRIIINVHRDDFTYFEWWRLMQAFWQKCVVVTEPCFPHPVFKPGIHFFEEAPRHIGQLVSWLIKSPEGQARAEQIRANAFAAMTGQSTLDQSVQRTLAFLEEAA